jgi:hypothetical protein
MGDSISSPWVPANSPEFRRVRGKHTLDTAVFFSSRDLRGTVDEGEYFIKVYQVLYCLYLVIAEREYDICVNEPIKIATMRPRMDEDIDMDYWFVPSHVSNRMKFSRAEVLEILKWGNSEDDYVELD